MSTGSDYVRFITEIEAKLERLSVEFAVAKYDYYLGNRSADLNGMEARISDIYLDPANFEKVVKAASARVDPDTRLAIARLQRWFALGQVNRHPDVYKLRNEIEDEVISFRPVIGGSEVSRSGVREILQKEDKQGVREEAYYCELPLARKISGRVLDLVRLRRDLARDFGAENYPDMVLTLQDNDVGDIRLLFDMLEEQTAIRFGDFVLRLAADASIEKPMPWDIAYLFNRKRLPDRAFPREGIMPAVKDVFGGLGFDVDALGVGVEFRDIPFGGLCFSIKVPEDVRILANPQNGHTYYHTMFHEFGHAVYSKLVEQEHFALKGDTSGCFTEGIAVFFSYFADNGEWLSQRKGLSEKQIEDYLDRLAYARIWRLRRLMCSSLLEFHMYEEPDQDIEAVWAQLMHKFLHVESRPCELWAASPFNVSHPVYLQNYVLAEMIAQQIHDCLSHQYATLLGNRVVAKFLIRNFFAPGGTVSWRDKVELATDRPLGPEALLESVGAG